MTVKGINILMVLFLLVGISNAQVDEIKDDYFYKLLTPEQALEIFGPVKGIKFNKIAGDKREVKDIIIKGNKISSILFN